MLRLKYYKVGPVGQGVTCSDFRLRDGIGWGGVVTETSDSRTGREKLRKIKACQFPRFDHCHLLLSSSHLPFRQ